MSFIDELKRRNVFRVGIAYVVTGWLLLQAADIVFDNVPAPDWVMQAIMVALLIGLPIALIIAWAFEMTPEGLKKEKDVDRTQSITHTTGRKLDRIIIAFLVIAVLLLLTDRMFFNRTAPVQVAPLNSESTVAEVDESPSVAVLPFLNLSGNQENEYFSDGLTETLLHMLAQLPDLRVAARTSAFAFKGQNKDVREVASTLGVAHILEGSVQRSGDQVRVTAQLIRADDGFHVWSQNYDRTLDNIFAIQDEIAGDVASALGASLLPGQTGSMQGVATTSTDAYDNYLRALEKNADFSYASLGEAESLLKNAIAADPDFFEAKVALARNYRLQASTGLIELEPALVKMRALIEQLLVERPNDPSAMGLDLLMRSNDTFRMGDFIAAQALLPEFEALLEIAPNETEVRQNAAGMLTGFQREEDAIALLEQGLLIDPLDPVLHRQLAQNYQQLDRLDEAETSFLKARELNPEDPNIVGSLAALSRQRGQVADMLNWYRQSAEMDPQDHEIPAIIASHFYRFNFLESGDYWANRTRALAADSPANRNLELTRARAVGDDENTKAIALGIMQDEVPDRNNVQENALREYVNIMRLQGNHRQAIEQLESISPGISDNFKVEDDLPLIIKRVQLMGLMKETLPENQFSERYEALIEVADAKGFPWRENPGALLTVAVFGNDYETALPAALEVLGKSNAVSDSWKRFEEDPEFSPLLNEPEMVETLARFKSDEGRYRAEIETLLEQPDWVL
jgi:TolB-like protein/Flp pilus assembly protein TadD